MHTRPDLLATTTAGAAPSAAPARAQARPSGAPARGKNATALLDRFCYAGDPPVRAGGDDIPGLDPRMTARLSQGMRVASVALALAVSSVSPAPAADRPPPDQSGYSLVRPAPDDKLRDPCFDRPARGTSACTVDAGRWQLETELFDGAFQRQHGVTTDDWRAVSPTLKLGVSDRADVEIALPLYQSERTHDAGNGATDTLSGVGDLTLAAKYALVGNSGSDLAVVVRPFLTVPTARSGLDAGGFQGGVLLPLSASLPAGWSLNITPEIDVLPNQTGGGRHAQAVASLGVSHGLGAGFSGTVEAWAQRDFDPGGATTQASFDLALAWTPKPLPDLQLDVGVNLGLTRDTPGAEVYAGVSKRF